MKPHFLIIIFIIFLTVPIFLWQGIYLPRSEFTLLRGLPEEKLFSVEKGQNVFQIAENLEREGLIKNKFLFNFYVLAKRAQKGLQVGQYSLNSSMNIPEIAKKIISGDVAQIVVTIPEGFTVKQVEEKLNLKLPGENPEGFLFPDTYYFPIDVSGKEVVEKMRENFEKKLNTKIPESGLTVKETTAQQGKTIFEIVTMASLIEKEVRTPEDKKLVSGILWKRLKNKMPLQVDATITYITGKKTTKISSDELQIDSSYNTYKYLGLPKGPISNPGLDSIISAVYPESSDYWYYLSTPEGKTIFSKTLKEHNLVKSKYLK